MKQTFKILGYATLLTAIAGVVAVTVIPSWREAAQQAGDNFADFYRQRESELIEALSSTDAEVSAARQHRSRPDFLDEVDEELYEF